MRILTAGESHGKGLVGILEGMPAGLKIDKKKIDAQLERRQRGYGRGDRMKIESDRIEIFSGLRFGVTLGTPITVFIENKDWKNWQSRMNVWSGKENAPVTVPRPGHADLAGAIKYEHTDLRNVLERSSARETAVRVALGAIARQLLDVFGIWIGSHVIQIHQIQTKATFRKLAEKIGWETGEQIRKLSELAENSELRCSDPVAEKKMKTAIQKAQKNGDTVGGIFEVTALHVPAGLGSYAAWDRRLDAAIASDFMSIPAIKAVEIGLGIENAFRFGSEVHDAIIPGKNHFPERSSNRAGGIEGGVSNGQPILVRATMKPIPTLTKPLPSVDLKTHRAVPAHRERADVCAVPAASVVGEAMMAIVLAKALCQKVGGDSMNQMKRHFHGDA
ncbi:chorismate synthase [bacterium]|nr:chorismate synthase [bacterium]RQV95559.1 MAG: chorismate synthase [bacterium]